MSRAGACHRYPREVFVVDKHHCGEFVMKELTFEARPFINTPIDKIREGDLVMVNNIECDVERVDIVGLRPDEKYGLDGELNHRVIFLLSKGEGPLSIRAGMSVMAKVKKLGR